MAGWTCNTSVCYPSRMAKNIRVSINQERGVGVEPTESGFAFQPDPVVKLTASFSFEYEKGDELAERALALLTDIAGRASRLQV